MYTGTLVDVINEAIDRDEYFRRKMDDKERRAGIEKFKQKVEPNRDARNNNDFQNQTRSVSTATAQYHNPSRFGKIGGFVNKLRNRF